MFEPMGIRIAARITDELAGKVGADYETIQKIVYGVCQSIAENSYKGDWVEMPNGATFTMTFKPEKPV